MIKLTSVNDSVIMTNNSSGSIDWVSNWRDEIEEDVRPGSANGHITSATTTTVVAAIAAAVHPVEDRVIESIIITNKGAGAQIIQLFKSVLGGTTYALTEPYTLGAYESLRVTEDGLFLNNTKNALATGPAGADGADGADGTDGLTVLNGATDPTTEGVDGDFYINTVNNKIFGPKATTWPAGVSLVGPTGPGGVDGLTILNGVIPPTTEGVDGDFYIDTAANNIYGPKATTWPAGVSLVGPTGPGGTDGLTILNGVIPPTTEGVDGDFYIDTAANNIYGPKATTWPAGVSLVGPTGPGGTDGYTILNGVIPPTTEGVDGDFYIDTAANNIYGPKATTWPAGVSLVGPAGSNGTNGSSLLTGTAAPTTEGVNGDTYLQDVTGSTTHGLTLYGPKAGGVWPAGVVIVAPVN